VVLIVTFSSVHKNWSKNSKKKGLPNSEIMYGQKFSHE